MIVQVLQHVEFEGLGSIEVWLSARDASVRYTRFFVDPELPARAAVDMVVVLGGPMSANDQRRYPWLRREKEFVNAAIRRGVPVVGVCLGAQIIASAMGQVVFPGRQKEIGWFPVEGIDSGEDAFRFPSSATVFHWHGETFDLPAGAVHLARSPACEQQAFQVGCKVIGLQFHLETTPETVGAMVEHCGHELVDGEYIQPGPAMQSVPVSTYSTVNRLMDRVLCYVAG